MKPERISFFTTHLGDGGIQRVFLNLSQALIQKGFEVEIVLTRSGPRNYDVPERIQIVDISAPRIYSSLPKLVRYLNKQQPPLLLSGGTAVNIIVLLAKKIARLKSPVIVSEHTTPSTNVEQSTDWRFNFVPPLAQWLYTSADSIICVSEGVARDLNEEFLINRNNLQVIYNPIVTDRMIEQSKESLDHQWFTRTETPVILAVGRLVPAKDFCTLIRAFARLRDEHQIRLVILGEGRNREKLEELINRLDLNQNIMLLGFVSNPYKYMRNADVFVLSSKREGFGNVLVEAMACGCPVVSTNCHSGPAEILENGKWGRLVPVESPKQLAPAVVDTLNDPIDGTQRAQRFHVSTITEEYINLFREVRTK